MSHIRMAGIPIDHLAAEMAAFPIASEAALRHGVTILNPRLSSSRSGAAATEMWRAAEKQLAAHSPNVSLDELIAMRDRTWFAETSRAGYTPAPLHEFVKRLARRHLKKRGQTAVPCLQRDHWHDGLDSDALSKARAREAWRWLTFALPPDLLLAALTNDEGSATHVDALCPQLEECLHRHGFAESHLHLGAGLEFPLLWVSAMLGLRNSGLAEEAFASPGADLDEGREMGGWLLRAAIARYVLAAFLVAHEDSQEPANLKDFLTASREELVTGLGLCGYHVLLDALRDLCQGTFDNRGQHADLVMCYSQMTQHCTGLPKPQRTEAMDARLDPSRRPQVSEALRRDPIANLLPAGSDGILSPEMRFVIKAFEYADQQSGLPDGKRDDAFLAIFWQVVRIRNIFYRHVVQRPMTPGLQWFIRVYGRLSAGRKSIGTALQLESAAHVSGFGHGLRALEVRTCAEPDSSHLFAMIDELDTHFRLLNESKRDGLNEPESYLTAATDRRDCEFGLVLHFAKDRGGGIKEGRPNGYWLGSNADPQKTPRNNEASVANPTGYRYADYYLNTVRPQAQAIGNVLLNFPFTLAVLRGIDVCTDELGVPAWVLAPAFRYLRDISCDVSARISGERVRIPPLRVSVHAGEDYVHLLTGLRNVDWAIRFLGLREGDRIGHGVALGVNAAAWAKSAGRIAVMREERLFDLLFEWHCYSANHVPVSESRSTYLSREIARLSQLVFGIALPPYELETLIELLHDENALLSAGFPEGHDFAPTRPMRSLDFPQSRRRAQRQLRHYLRDESLFRRGRELEWLDPSDEAASLEVLQDYLRTRIGTLGLAVEANVSSNLLIANLTTLEAHPLFRLCPPFNDSKLCPVNLVFGSDDPITFASNLRNEYMLTHDALVQGGHLSNEQATMWLGRVQENGLKFRFTIPRPGFGGLRDSPPIAASTVHPLL